MTTQKTGGGVGAVGALALTVTAVIALAITFQAPRGDRGRQPPPSPTSDGETIVASVTFTPTPRLGNPVQVLISVGPTLVIEELVTHSPFNVTFRIPRGAQVLLSAHQDYPSPMNCVLQADGKIVDHTSRDDEGSARCWHNRAG